MILKASSVNSKQIRKWVILCMFLITLRMLLGMFLDLINKMKGELNTLLIGRW